MAGESKPGRAKSAAANKPAAKPLRGSHRSGLLNLDSEQSARLLLIGAVAAIVVIAAGFIAFGYWYSVVKPRNRTVLQVDDTKISYTAMKRRMGYEYFQNVNYQKSPQILPEGSYQALLNELTEVNRAESGLGVTLDDAEFDQKLRGRLGVSQEGTAKEFADAFRRQLDTTGLNESEYRRLIRGELLDTKIHDKFKAEAPPAALMAKLEVIAAPSQDAAQKAIDRINGGEDFATVAKSVSQETDVQTTGGLHDYAPKGAFNKTYDDYAFTTNDIGKLSAPLSSGATGASYVVRVVDRSQQPVQEAQKSTIAGTQFSDWLKNTQDDMQANGKLKRDWQPTAQNSALLAVVTGSGSKLAAQQQRQQSGQVTAAAVRATVVADLTSRPRPTVDPNATPVAPAASPPAAPSGTNSSPAAPSQPVAPGNNGQ